MRRQLYRGGGITGLYPRQKYGIGSWVKERVRKLIPNELADVATKAAPFVAPFNPGIAALMRRVGRFDQRGSISDALKQGALTYGGGQLARQLGGAGVQTDFLGTPGDRFTTPLRQDRMEGLRNLFRAREKTQIADKPVGKIDSTAAKQLMTTDAAYSGNQGLVKNIWETWQDMTPGMKTAIVGVGSGALAGVAQWFENQIPQEPGESIEEWRARREVAVKKLMRQYMDNTRAYDAAWSSMTDQQKDETVGQYYNQGGRVGYQTGGISMGNTLAQNIAANRAQAADNQSVLQGARIQREMNERVRKGSQIEGLNLRNRYIPGESGGITGIESGARMYGINPPQNYNLYNPSLAPNEAQLFASYRNQGLNPNQIKAIAYHDQLQKRGNLPYHGGDLHNPMFMGNIFKSEPELRAEYQEGLRRAMLEGSPEVYWDQGSKEYKLHDSEYLRNLYNKSFEVPGGGTYRNEQEAIADLGIERYNQLMSKGGRVGLYGGGEPEAGIKSLDAGAPDITYEGKEGPQAPMKMAGMRNRMSELIIKLANGTITDEEMIELRNIESASGFSRANEAKGPVLPSPEDPINPFAPKPTGPVLPDKMMAAQGGRIGQMIGTGPAGLPGIPRQAPDGMEFDMRQNGGFQPLGAKEKKDDVPAMLAKNEFVFTADAVRGAGGGDIELGAQRMYDTMKNLEKRVV